MSNIQKAQKVLEILNDINEKLESLTEAHIRATEKDNGD